MSRELTPCGPSTADDALMERDANIVSANFQGRYDFGKGRAALLIAYQPKYMTLPRNLSASKILQHRLLKNMALVTDVTTCPSYVLYFNAEGTHLAAHHKYVEAHRSSYC